MSEWLLTLHVIVSLVCVLTQDWNEELNLTTDFCYGGDLNSGSHSCKLSFYLWAIPLSNLGIRRAGNSLLLSCHYTLSRGWLPLHLQFIHWRSYTVWLGTSVVWPGEYWLYIGWLIAAFVTSDSSEVHHLQSNVNIARFSITQYGSCQLDHCAFNGDSEFLCT